MCVLLVWLIGTAILLIPVAVIPMTKDPFFKKERERVNEAWVDFVLIALLWPAWLVAFVLLYVDKRISPKD